MNKIIIVITGVMYVTLIRMMMMYVGVGYGTDGKISAGTGTGDCRGWGRVVKTILRALISRIQPYYGFVSF